jgi:hypothetical protein
LKIGLVSFVLKLQFGCRRLKSVCNPHPGDRKQLTEQHIGLITFKLKHGRSAAGTVARRKGSWH